jgi:PASTA domain
MPIAQTIGKHKVAFGIGGAIALGVGIYFVEKNKKSSAAASTAAPAGASQYGYGYGYGSGVGLGASGNLYGYGYGYGSNYGTSGFGGSSGYGYQYPYGATTPPAVTPPANNAAWAEAAEGALTNDGYNSTTVAAALGKYLTGGTLTADQEGIVRAAIAFENYPPVPGANGYPPAMHSSTGTGQKKTKQATVPKVTGMPYLSAAAALKLKGFVPRRAEKNVGIVTSQNPAAGAKADKGTAVVLAGKGTANKKA